MIGTKPITIRRIITWLFALLPLVDSVNGIFVSKGLPSIGTLYKLLLLGVLLVFALRKGYTLPAMLLWCIFPILYVVCVIFINTTWFSGTLINTDYPIKLAFNVLLLILLLNCVNIGYLDGKDIYSILNINTWLMIGVILIPYSLGLGNTIYSSGIGYKAFFYSNNELSVALIILFYVSLYRLSCRLGPMEMVQLLGVLVCVLLLNTKSGMIACLVGVALFVAEYLLRKNTRGKCFFVLCILLAVYGAKDFILTQIESFLSRQAYLSDLYGGSLLDTILSGRSIFLADAWTELKVGPGFLFRFLFGNGFCSETLVEMDFVDIFFYLGAMGVILLTGSLIYIYAKSCKNFKKDHTLMRPLGYLMAVGFAFLAGHIFFMATSGCYFVLMCALNLTYCPEPDKQILKEC